jgi:hypothetical protein
MEAISGSEGKGLVHAYGKHGTIGDVHISKSSDESTKTNFTDLSSLAQRANASGEDIRPDAIKRAQELLSNPNWPNDSDLEGLSEKLLSTEDFTS